MKDEPAVLSTVPAASSEHMATTVHAPHMLADPTVVMPPARSAYGRVETKHPLLAAAKIASTHDMVEPMWYLYVSVVKARDLPAMNLTGPLDPYVEVKLGNFKGVTRYFKKNANPVWREKFTISRDHLQTIQLEVMVKDKDLLRDNFVGHVVLDLSRVPSRLPQDSRIEPQWYRLAEKLDHGGRGLGEIMLAVWFGTQHDESFPEVWPSKVHSLANSRRSKVYYSLKLMYLKVSVIQAEDLVEGRSLASTIAKLQLGGQIWRTGPGQPTGSANLTWNEEFRFVVSEPREDPLGLVVTVEEEHVGDSKDEIIGHVIIPVACNDLTNSVSSKWFRLTVADMAAGSSKNSASKILMRLSLETEYHVLT